MRANGNPLGALVLLAVVLAAILDGAFPVRVRGAGWQLTPPPPTGGQSTSSATIPPTGLLPAAPVVRGRYLDASPSVVKNTGAGRDRLTLVVDVTPKPGMHVYAPGNKSYTAVQLTIDTGRGDSVAPTKYPKPNAYFFAPLNEHVQVFNGVFRLSREVTRRAGSTTTGSITGRLEYQACDDKVCYLPQTLSLTWTLSND